MRTLLISTLLASSSLYSGMLFAKANEGSAAAGSPTPVPVPPTPTPVPPIDGSTPTPVETPATPTPVPAPAATAPIITAIRSDIVMPTKKAFQRGGQKTYPFDELAVGQSFGLIGKTAKGIASTVSSANKRNEIQAKNEDGTLKVTVTERKDATGVVVGHDTTPVMIKGKTFSACNVDPTTDPDKATCRVFRTA